MTNTTTSAEGISPPPPATHERAVAAATAALFDRLNELIWQCGPKSNTNDRLLVSIAACIEEGIATRQQIIGVLKTRFNYRHVALMLNKSTGTDPERHWWRRDEQGVYHNIR